MNHYAVEIEIPNVFIQVNKKTLLVPSMVLSSFLSAAFATFLPQLMPLWMAWSTGSRV